MKGIKGTARYTIGHFRDDLSSQSLDCCRNLVFSTNHLTGAEKSNNQIIAQIT